MKKLILFVLLCCVSVLVSAQGMTNSSARITISSGTYVSITGAAGNYTNTGTGSIDLVGTGILDLQGNWINNGAGVFTVPPLTDGTVRFTGGNAQSIGGSAATTFENVNINKTVGTTLTLSSANTNVEGNFLISSGILNASSQPISVARNWTANSGTFNSGTGTVTFDGTIAQTIIAGGNSFYNVTFNNNLVGTADINLTDPMTIAHTGTFTDGILYYSGSGALTFANGADCPSGGSASSFVNTSGTNYVSKTGNNGFIFPVGEVSGLGAPIWAPVEIASPSANSTITANYNFFTSPFNWNPGDMCDFTVLDHTSGVEHWILSTTASTPDVTLYWKDANRSGMTLLSDIVNAHYGSCWEKMGDITTGTIGPGGSGTVLGTGFTSYGPITFGTKKNTNPLPIDLLIFEAKCENNKVQINWVTATETNNEFFTLERSTNANDWVFVADIPGAGNSNSILNYQYSDENLINGDSYYRLRQTDFNGNKEEFLPIAVSCSEQEQDEYVLLYPNPAYNQINILINSSVSGNAQLVVTDIMGQKVIMQQVDLNVGINILTIDVKQLSDANYNISIISPDKTFPIQRLIINK